MLIGFTLLAFWLFGSTETTDSNSVEQPTTEVVEIDDNSGNCTTIEEVE